MQYITAYDVWSQARFYEYELTQYHESVAHLPMARCLFHSSIDSNQFCFTCKPIAGINVGSVGVCKPRIWSSSTFIYVATLHFFWFSFLFLFNPVLMIWSCWSTKTWLGLGKDNVLPENTCLGQHKHRDFPKSHQKFCIFVWKMSCPQKYGGAPTI